MKNIILVSLMAVLAVMTLSVVSALSLQNSVTSFAVEARGVSIDTSNTLSVDAGETLPLTISFISNADVDKVRVKAEINGFRNDISDESDRFNVIAGKLYTKTLSLNIPSDIDPTEDFIIEISLVSQDAESFVQDFSITVQRKLNKIEILDVESDKTVNAGSSLPVNVVLQNSGSEELKNVFVTVSIPDLGISKRVFFDDLSATDNCSDDNCNNNVDSAERRVILNVPTNTMAGVYDLKVEASNADSSDVVTDKIAVVGAEQESSVVVPVASKDVKNGETVSYDLIIINSGSKVGVYQIVPETSDGVAVTVESPVVTVGAGSSTTVKVDVQALKEGTYNFALNVNSQDSLVKRVVLTAVVSGQIFTSNITILTIVLAIVFVVLLVVLIVLLTRKPARTEQLEESYY